MQRTNPFGAHLRSGAACQLRPLSDAGSYGAAPATSMHTPMGSSCAARYFANTGGGYQVNPTLQALVSHAMITGTPIGGSCGPHGIIQARFLLTRLAVLIQAANQAIMQGRTSVGPKGTKPTDTNRQIALGQSWTPKRGPAQAGVTPMSQLDYNDQLGKGGSSIRSAGCFLTALAMASGKITGDSSLNPRVANDRIRNAGGFSGSNLIVDRAADALGMKVTGRHAVTGANVEKMTTELDRNLDAGRPVVAGVDYKSGKSSSVSQADHFLTITGRNADGSYAAIDPAGGKSITFSRGSDGHYHSGKYTLSELTFLDGK